MAIVVGTGRGAQAGVLVKNAEALQTMERVDTLVMDKTRTLTEGKPRLTRMLGTGDVAENEVLRLAESLEISLRSKAICAQIARARNLGPATMRNVPRTCSLPLSTTCWACRLQQEFCIR